MDSKKQKLLIEYLISSTDTFALCQTIVEYTYFDPEFRNSVKYIKKYYEDYSQTPQPRQIEAEHGINFKKYDIQPDEIKYLCAEIETFCKHAAIRKAILAAPALEDKGKFEEISTLFKEAVTVSLTKDLGLQYFSTVEDRLERMLNEDPTSPTGWTDVDAALFGGISRKELLLVSANSGGGKSITLANLAFNFINTGLNVLYISLELSEDVVAQRFDTMFTGIGRRDWREHTDEITKSIALAADESGRLDIVQMSAGTTSNDIRAFLKEFYLKYGFEPDLLVVDYLDNMEPNEAVSADNVFEKDKRSSEQLRQIAVDHNMFTATASQLNRSAIGATSHDHSQIAGGISKINVSDVYWSIIMTDENRAMGTMFFHIQKTRNSDGVGKTIKMRWDNKHLRILDEPGEGLKFKAKEHKELSKSTDDGNKLLSMLGDI